MREDLVPHYLAKTPFKAHILELMVDMALSGAGGVCAPISRFAKRRDQQSLLRNIKCPTLIFCGAQDQIALPKRHEFMTKFIEPAELVVIENAGHLPTLE